MEPRRQAERGQAGKGGVQRALHPAVVGVHRPAGNLRRPALVDSKRPHLRGGQRQHIKALKQPQQMAVEGAAHLTGPHEIHAAQALRLVVLPQRLGLDLAPCVRQLEQRRHPGRHQRAAPHQPGLPQHVGIKAQRHWLDQRAFGLAAGQRGLQHGQQAVFDGLVPAQITQPADAQAAQRPGVTLAGRG